MPYITFLIYMLKMLGWQFQTINKIFTNMLIIAEGFYKNSVFPSNTEYAI